MALDLSFITDHTLLFSTICIIGFVVWKFIIEPIQNDGQPIPGEDGQTDQQDQHQNKTSSDE